MAASSDAVAEGFVASPARPGGNITGLSFLVAEPPGKRLELLRETVPQSTRIAVLRNPVGPGDESRQPLLHNLTGAAQALGLQLHIVEVRSADELDTAFTAMTQEGADALLVAAAPTLYGNLRGRIVDLAAKHQLPAMYQWKMYVDAGGLMSYGPSLPDMWRRAGIYVNKILKGAKPADFPWSSR